MGNPWSSRQTKAQPKPQFKHKQPSKGKERRCVNTVNENLVLKDVRTKVLKCDSKSEAVLAA